jgi:phosphoserine phosphatase
MGATAAAAAAFAAPLVVASSSGFLAVTAVACQGRAFRAFVGGCRLHHVQLPQTRAVSNVFAQAASVAAAPGMGEGAVVVAGTALEGIAKTISAQSSHVITILSQGSTSTPLELSAIAAALVACADGKIDLVNNRTLLALGPHAHQMHATLPEGSDVAGLRLALFEEGQRTRADLNIQCEMVWRGAKRLAVFDLDSTLIAEETIDELAAEVGAADAVARITRRAMNGEVNFRDALAERVALLRGMHVDRLESVKRRVRIMPGAHRLIAALRRMGCETAVVSGGFDFLANHIRDELNLHHAYANRLEVGPDDRLTGRTIGDIVDGEFKASTLRRLADARGLAKHEILAVGDGSNDIPMIGLAGLGVAFNAKPIVQKSATTRVNQESLASILYLLGLSDAHVDHLIA